MYVLIFSHKHIFLFFSYFIFDKILVDSTRLIYIFLNLHQNHVTKNLNKRKIYVRTDFHKNSNSEIHYLIILPLRLRLI